MEFNAEKNVYTFDTMAFTVEGRAYAVTAWTASIQESGMPVVTLAINPKPDPNPDDVEVPALSDFMQWHSDLQAIAATRKGRAALTFKAVSENDTQELILSDWLFTQAGILEISASGSFSTQVVIQHPIYGATTAALTFLNTYKAAGEGDPLEGADVVEMILNGMTAYIEQRSPEEAVPADVAEEDTEISADTIEEIDQAVYAKVVEAMDILKANVEFDPDYAGKYRFPLQGVDDTIVADYYALGGLKPDPYLESRESPYNTFMSMITQMMLMTYGTFSGDKIRVRPAEPWAAPDMDMAESDVSSIVMPVDSLAKLSGVAIMGGTGNKDMHENQDDKVGGPGSPKTNDVSVMGAYINFIKVIDGRLKIIGIPEFLTGYADGTPSGDSQAEPAMQNSDTGEDSGGANPQADSAMDILGDLWGEALNSYCEDDFWRSFNADVTMGLVTRLMLSRKDADGKDVKLRPGMVLSLKDDDGNVMYTCYITAIQHTVSVQDGRAYTSLQGAYARGAAGVTGVYDPAKPLTTALYNTKVTVVGGSGQTDGGGQNSTPDKMKQPADASYGKFTKMGS